MHIGRRLEVIMVLRLAKYMDVSSELSQIKNSLWEAFKLNRYKWPVLYGKYHLLCINQHSFIHLFTFCLCLCPGAVWDVEGFRRLEAEQPDPFPPRRPGFHLGSGPGPSPSSASDPEFIRPPKLPSPSVTL